MLRPPPIAFRHQPGDARRARDNAWRLAARTKPPWCGGPVVRAQPDRRLSLPSFIGPGNESGFADPPKLVIVFVTGQKARAWYSGTWTCKAARQNGRRIMYGAS